jgi:ABC-type multidrug transport system fused ATPase/permease subunit
MSWVDWRLALFAQLVSPMSLLGPRFFSPKARDAAESARRDNNSAAGLARIERILSEIPTVTDVKNMIELPLFISQIQLKHISYSIKSGNRILDQVSLTIHHREFVAGCQNRSGHQEHICINS